MKKNKIFTNILASALVLIAVIRHNTLTYIRIV